MNVDEEKSPVGLPIAVIVCAPARALPTLNEPSRMPPEIVQVKAGKSGGWPTGVPDRVQLVSVGENPEPDTRTSGVGKAKDHT